MEPSARQSRREFLGSAGALTLTLSTLSLRARWGWALERAAAGPGWLLIGDRPGGALPGQTGAASLVVADPANGARFVIPVPCYPHGIIGHPIHRDRVLVMPQFEQVACEVDLAEKKVIQELHGAEGRSFYGHGAYSSDGKIAYIVEAGTELKNGCITVRDAKDFKLLGKLDSFGIGPHDCRLIDGGRKMVVANGGSINGAIGRLEPKYAELDGGTKLDSCVAIIELRTGKLVEKLPAEFPGSGAGHLDITSKGELAVAFRPEAKALGPVMSRARSGKLELFSGGEQVQKRMLGQALSVRIHEPSGIVGVTNPEGNIVTFWDLRKRSFIRSLDFERPMGLGLTLDRKYFILTTFDGKTRFIDPRSLEIRADAYPEVVLGNGPHLLVWGRRRA